MYAREMVVTHPNLSKGVNAALIHCVEECYACAQICGACADACLGEAMALDLVQCIRLDLDCADLCLTAGVIATRRSGDNDAVVRKLLATCAAACARCADECERHADVMEHCRICAAQCRQCEEACREAIASLDGSAVRMNLAH